MQLCMSHIVWSDAVSVHSGITHIVTSKKTPKNKTKQKKKTNKKKKKTEKSLTDQSWIDYRALPKIGVSANMDDRVILNVLHLSPTIKAFIKTSLCWALSVKGRFL